MSSYIFNFNKASNKGLIIFYFVCLLLCYVVADISIACYENYKTTPDHYIEVLSSKKNHMQKRFPASQKLDVIFIGSSRTLYHVDTAFLTKKGIISYNLSLVAHEPLSYPSMIKAAMKMNPKAIAIELDVPWLYNNFENRIPTPSLTDISAQIKCGLDTTTVWHFTIDYIKKISLVSRYAVTLYSRSKQFFSKIISGYLVAGKINSTSRNAPKNKNYITKYVKCENGDGILYGSDPVVGRNESNYKIQLGRIRWKNIQFFNYLISLVQKKNVKVFVFLAASIRTPKVFNLNLIKEKIHAPIIDLVHSVPEDAKYWVDTGHLNNFGREIFTRKIYEQIKKNNILSN